jgi:CheY-like chemotaxis protein
VLLVEDDIDSAYLTEVAAREAQVPFQISVVNDGVEGLDFLMKRGPFASVQRPDIILLDLNLPRKNGQELLSDIKADAALKDIPVVILTTSDQHRDLSSAYGLSAECYKVKPNGFNEYVDLLKSLADAYRHGRLVPLVK